jgi:hypothetical protein
MKAIEVRRHEVEGGFNERLAQSISSPRGARRGLLRSAERSARSRRWARLSS